jgi:hypothetical protein
VPSAFSYNKRNLSLFRIQHVSMQSSHQKAAGGNPAEPTHIQAKNGVPLPLVTVTCESCRCLGRILPAGMEHAHIHTHDACARRFKIHACMRDSCMNACPYTCQRIKYLHQRILDIGRIHGRGDSSVQELFLQYLLSCRQCHQRGDMSALPHISFLVPRKHFSYPVHSATQ